MTNKTGNSESLFDALRLFHRSDSIAIFEGSVGLFILIVDLLCNLVVCVIFVQHKETANAFNVYSLSLAVADIILSAVAMPFSVLALFKGYWDFGSAWCTIQGVVAVWSCEASILTMTLAALHRYTKMLRTPFHKRLYTKGFIIKSIIFAWVLAIMGPVIYLLKGSSFAFVPAFAICTFDYYALDTTFAALMVIFLSIIPFNIILFCYLKVWRFVQAHKAAMSMRQVPTEEIRLNKLVGAIVFSFVLCWTPLVVVVFIIAFQGVLFVPREVCLFAIFMASTSSCLNPIIYTAFFRDAKKIFCRKIRCCCKLRAVSQIGPKLESTKIEMKNTSAQE
ncbi:melatonin receptor type 1A-like [Actinia tenebrosa]|uniref:Melatonin receptor type 1A-like n=1 Tax=Actinia tenebrosa TaxID=6105 RepID=A0A6P8H355_ACTTE|nr:melatonin receptor type 1A-like [Actinia tenebrosa]